MNAIQTHLDLIKELINGKCKTTAEDVLNAAKTSVGNDTKYLSFSLIQSIKSLKFLETKDKDYVDMIQLKVLAILLQILFLVRLVILQDFKNVG